MNKESKVYIVDDDEAIRKALSFLMNSEGLPAQLYASGEDFLAEVSPDMRGCLLLDVRMPGISGLHLQQLLKQKHIALPVIIMTGHGDVAMAVNAMKAGVMDFIEKPFDNDELIHLIHKSFSHCEKIQQNQHNKEICVQRLESLTNRERQVLDLLVEGNQNKVIAAKLGISPRTVELHRARVMEKLEARSLSEIVRIALIASDQNTVAM